MIAKADEVETDEAFEREAEKTVNLYQVSDASGNEIAIAPNLTVKKVN